MSGHGRPPLCKPEHVNRARELCARGAINPDLLEPASWARQQNDRRKGRKGRKPRILRKWGPFRRWREAAETGGNWRKPPAGPLLEEPSAVLPSHPRGPLQALIGVSLAEIAEIPCKNLSRSQPHCASLFRGALQDLPAVHQRQSG
jgi:hypothetical protein